MTNKVYRLSWEMVSLRELWRYSDADPTYYKNTTQIIPNSAIPDEHWHRIERNDTNPFQQHSALKEWADADTGFVRNVVLEESVAAKFEWQVVPAVDVARHPADGDTP